MKTLKYLLILSCGAAAGALALAILQRKTPVVGGQKTLNRNDFAMDAVDQIGEASFPASDAPSWTPTSPDTTLH